MGEHERRLHRPRLYVYDILPTAVRRAFEEMTRPRYLYLLALVGSMAIAPSPSATEHEPHPGDQVTDFAFTDFAGHQHHLSDFAGQYVLLDFSATWCQPCLHEVPDFKQAFEQFQSCGLLIIGMNT